MDKRSLVLYLSGLAAAGAVVGLAVSCSDQPRIKCTAGHGPFAAVYSTPAGAANCGLLGDGIGVEVYNYPRADLSNLDPNRGSVGMQPIDSLQPEIDSRGGEADVTPDAGRLPYATGDWGSAEPGSDNFCGVPNITTIQQNLPYVAEVPPGPDGGGGHEAVPSLNVTYKWSNVRFFNTPAAPGTQLVADLAYTRLEGLADGGAGTTPCTAQFHVVGLWPYVGCSDDDDPKKTDPTKCSPEPDNSKGRPTGSGISPDLVTKCDENLHLCVLVNEPR